MCAICEITENRMKTEFKPEIGMTLFYAEQPVGREAGVKLHVKIDKIGKKYFYVSTDRFSFRESKKFERNEYSGSLRVALEKVDYGSGGTLYRSEKDFERSMVLDKLNGLDRFKLNHDVKVKIADLILEAEKSS